MAQRVTLRSLILVTMVAGVCLVAATYAVIAYNIRKTDMLQEANVHLLAAGHFARTLAGAGYHDRIVDQASIPKAEFDRIMEAYDELCLRLGLQYIWSLMELDGKIVFTTATHSVLTNKHSACATFLEVHTNPEAYRHALATMQPEFSCFRDKLGEGRMVLLPAWDRQRRPYLFAASIQLAGFDALLRRTLGESILISLLIAALFSLVALVVSRLLTRPLTRLTVAIARMGKGELDLPLDGGGTRELRLLAAAFEGMRQTVRQQIEALGQSQANLSAITESTQDLIFSVDVKEFRLLHFNSAFAEEAAKHYGVQARLGLTARDILPRERWPVWETLIQRAVTQGPYNAEHLRVEDQKYFEVSFGLIRTGPQVTGVSVFIRDITARKQAETALRESEARLNFALEMNQTGAWELNLLDHTAHRTLIHDRIFGYATLQSSWTYELFLEHVLPADRPEVDRRFREATAALSDWSVECRIRRTDGEVRWIWAVGGHERNPEGQPVRMSGIVQDITGRKQAEAALRENEALLRSFFDSPGMSRGVVEVEGDDFRFVFVNDVTAKNFGQAKEAIRGRLSRDLGYPEAARRRLLEQMAQCCRTGQPLTFEHHHQFGGQDWWLYFTLSHLGDGPAGKPRFAYAAANITERKQAEDALRASQAQLQAVFESTEDLIWSMNVLTLEIQDFNSAFAEEIFCTYGLRLRPGMHLRDIIPADRVPVWAQQLQRAITEGRYTDEFFWPHHPKYFECTFNPIVKAGQAVSVSIFAKDITARKRLEQQLLEISEREQRRIGQDLHDGVGQQLAALRFLSSALRQKLLAQQPVAPGEFDRLDHLLAAAIKEVLGLARGLHPVNTDSLGLMHGLRELCRTLKPLLGVPCEFDCADPVLVHDPVVALNLYRIAQEATRNAAIHGAPKTIRVQLSQQAGLLRMVIKDDGKGMARAKRRKGLGLEIMRYRAQAIGAVLEIHSEPGAGVTITCELPGKA